MKQGCLADACNIVGYHTGREKEIVHLLANGFDSNGIAEKLFISEGTVRTHRKNILQKTEARNSVHLVRMAVANGWV